MKPMVWTVALASARTCAAGGAPATMVAPGVVATSTAASKTVANPSAESTQRPDRVRTLALAVDRAASQAAARAKTPSI